MKIIFDYNRTLFDPETDSLYGGAFSLLESLAVRHTLYLVSKNEDGRSSRFAELEISRFFTEIRFVSEKTPNIFRELVGQNMAIVVGDSISSEIAVGNKMGLITIRIKQGKFSDWEPSDIYETPTHTASSLNEVKNIISTYESIQ